jgi:hypothetical protein
MAKDTIFIEGTIPVFDTYEEIVPEKFDPEILKGMFDPKKYWTDPSIYPIERMGFIMVRKDNYNNLDSFNNDSWDSGEPAKHIGLIKNAWFGGFLKVFYSDFDDGYSYAIKITKEDARKEIIRTENMHLFDQDEYKELA